MSSREHILESCRRLDTILLPAIASAEMRFGVRFGEDPYRGLAVDAESARVPAAIRPSSASPELAAWPGSVAADRFFSTLKKVAPQITPVDFGLLLLALAPEADSVYEKRFGFLQDDVTRRRASVELALALFDPTGAERVADRLGETAPLVAHRMIELVDPTDGRTGWQAKQLRLDEQFARWLFGVGTLDSRLVAFAQVLPEGRDTDAASVPERLRGTLARVAAVPPVRVYLHGPDARVNLRTAELLARHLDRGLLLADATRLAAADRPAEVALRLVREARWFHHVLVIGGIDALHAPDRQKGWEQVAEVLARYRGGHLIAIGHGPRPPASQYPLGLSGIDIPLPDPDERFEFWSGVLDAPDRRLSAEDRRVLAERYSLTRTQIESATADAAARAKYRQFRDDADHAVVTFDDLSIAARSQGGQDLETLTTKIAPKVTLDDLVVPADARRQLDEIVARMENRPWVLREWGFARLQSYGLGVNALFTGPSGTGKTMAAEALAKAIGKDLYRIDLTSVVSKYIGETEQKLEQVFRSAESTQAVLFIDEADSLLGKRSEVKDAHDRYANLEVSYLLQRMERYDGLILLATNLAGNLDDAFLRRMAAVVHFQQPSVEERRHLWRKAWPTNDKGTVTVPLAPEPGYALDYDFLADRFLLTGGNIRNAVLAAAFSAAARKHHTFVTMNDVLHGVRREFQKLGQTMTDRELGLDLFLVPPAPPVPKPAAPKAAAYSPTEYAEVGGES